MSLTGSGFDSSFSGGSFLGKKKSSSWRKSDRYRGSSNCLSEMSRFNSGSGPGGGGFIDWDTIIPSSESYDACAEKYTTTLKQLSLRKMNAASHKLLQILQDFVYEEKLRLSRRRHFPLTDCNSTLPVLTVHF